MGTRIVLVWNLVSLRVQIVPVASLPDLTVVSSRQLAGSQFPL